MSSLNRNLGRLFGFALATLFCGFSFAQGESSDFDYSRLVHPDIVTFLQLSDAQSAEIAKLVGERAEKIAAAAEPDRIKVSAEFNEKIKGLLSAEQQERLSQLPELRKLKFNFGSPNWEDVLRWFAKQSDLSLVMSSPPAGAFNYTDSREYTPAQAIDLLNSILLTKGYTLVRRDKLLILVEIKDGVPDEILPRVTLEELDKRGTFEIVSVMFSLGDKPMDIVQAEIKPILGSYGKIAPLPNSKQLLITETVGKIRAINLLIQSVASVAPPVAKVDPGPPEPPVLQSFELGQLEAKTTIETLKQIAPTAIITSDTAAGKLIAFGPPSQLKIVDSYLELLNAGEAAGDTSPKLQIYQFDPQVDGKQVQEQLALVAPQAKVALDTAGQRLLVFASEKQHQQIQQTLQQLEVIGADNKSRVVQVFHLNRASPKAASQIALAVSPRASVTIDEATSALIVRADANEMDIIRQLVEQLDSAGPAEDGLTLKSFSIGKAPQPEFLSVLQKIAPHAKIQVDEANGSIFVIASAADIRQIEPLIGQYQIVQSSDLNGKLVSYEVTPAQKTRFLAVSSLLSNELKSIKVIPDESTQRLSIWANPQQHEFVSKMLEQIKEGGDTAPQHILKTYEANVDDPANLIALLRELHPQAKLSWNSTNDKIVAWSLTDEQEKIGQSLQRLLAELPVGEPETYEVLDLKQLDPAMVPLLLQPVVPKAKLTVDAAQRRLLVFAKRKDYDLLRATLEKLTAQDGGSNSPQVKMYATSGVDVTTTISLLKSMVPQAQVTSDTAGFQLIVVGNEAAQQSVALILGQLREGSELAAEKTVKFYSVEPSQSTAVLELLTQTIPAAKVKWDASAKKLSVIASTRDHARVAKTIADIQLTIGPVETTRLMVYPIRPDLRARFDAILGSLSNELTNVRVVEEKRPGELAVMATEPQHLLIKGIVEQLAKPIEGVEPFSMVVFPTNQEDPKQIADFLTTIYPSANIVPDAAGQRLLIWAPPSIQADIDQALKEFSKDQPPTVDNPLSLNSYKLQNSKASAVAAMLQKLVPRMELVASDDQGLLIAWGRKLDHEKLKSAINQVNLPDDPKTLSVELYSTGKMEAQQASALLSKILPDATIIPQPASFTIAVLARGEQHKLVSQTLEQIGELAQNDGPATVNVYRVDRSGSTAAIAAISPIVPQAKLIAGATSSQLIGFATAKDHERIKELVGLIESDVPEGSGLVLRVYQLRKDLASQVRPLIQAALPTLKIVGTDPSAFAVWARNDEHQRLRSMIEEAEKQLATPPKSFRSYALENFSATQAKSALQLEIASLAFIELSDERSLTLLATEEEHAKVAEILKDLRSAITKRAQQIVSSYHIPETSLSLLVSALPKELSAQATIKTDAESNSLIVIADSAVQEQLQLAISDLQTKLPKLEKNVAKIYPLNGLVVKDWQALVAQIAPGATVATDPGSGSLVVTARPQVHATLNELMNEFRNNVTGEKTARAYRVSRADLQVISDAITALLPNTKVSADKLTNSLIVVAREEDQKVIASTIEQIDRNAPTAAISQVYPIPSGDAAALAVALKSLVPSGAYVADATGKAILVLATLDEQATIKSTVEQWANDPARKLTSKVYAFLRADPQAASVVLQRLLPGATIAVDLASRSIAATATNDQHQLIEQTVKELDDASQSPVSRVYPANGLTAKDWQALMAQLAPGASVATDPVTNSLVVTARPPIHEMIKELMDDFRNLAVTGKTVKAYRLLHADVQVASDALASLLPNSKISTDKATRSLVVVADERDQATASATVEQLDRNAPSAPISHVYPVASGDALALATALKSLVPTGAFVADASGKSILVLAAAEEQAIAKETIEQWAGDSRRTLVSKVYPFENADPQAALTVLQRLLPGATIAVDVTSRSLAATATADQHQLIEQTVQAMDGIGNKTGQIELRSYFVTRMPPESLAKALRDLFKADAQVSIAAEKDSRSIIAVARPQQHEMIKALLDNTEKQIGGEDAEMSLQTYPLTQSDGKTFAETLNKLFEKEQAPPQISFDSSGQRILALATKRHHELIQESLRQLTGDPQEFDVFRLRKNEPGAVEATLRNLFQNEPRGNAPSIDVDFDNQSLLVRATAVQMKRIKEVLTRLGESDFLSQDLTDKNELLRVVPVNQNMDRVLEQLELIWPQLKKNELRIIRPEPQKPDQVIPKSLDSLPDPDNSEKKTLTSAVAENIPVNEWPQDIGKSDDAPILIIPDNRKLTIASTDKAALDDLEELLNVILRKGGTDRSVGNFEAFSLHNAGAKDMADLLTEVFKELPIAKRGGQLPVVVSADERLNIVIVHGSRADREVIGKLLETLDSPDLPDSLAINQPVIVPIRNTSAERILTILNNVYKTQLSSGGGRKQVSIPEGISTEVASVLQQVNAATAGPILTLGVDSITNSIIVLAPPQLRDQVKTTISQLDSSVEIEPGDEIQIIQLKAANPARIQRALDMLLKEPKK